MQEWRLPTLGRVTSLAHGFCCKKDLLLYLFQEHFGVYMYIYKHCVIRSTSRPVENFGVAVVHRSHSRQLPICRASLVQHL